MSSLDAFAEYGVPGSAIEAVHHHSVAIFDALATLGVPVMFFRAMFSMSRTILYAFACVWVPMFSNDAKDVVHARLDALTLLGVPLISNYAELRLNTSCRLDIFLRERILH